MEGLLLRESVNYCAHRMMSSAGGRDCQMGWMGPRSERPGWAGLGRVGMTETVRCGEGRGGGRADWDDGVCGWRMVDGGGDGDENGSAGFQVGHRSGRLFQEGWATYGTLHMATEHTHAQ